MLCRRSVITRGTVSGFQSDIQYIVNRGLRLNVRYLVNAIYSRVHNGVLMMKYWQNVIRRYLSEPICPVLSHKTMLIAVLNHAVALTMLYRI